jgi:pimeloyl-ACP methyl ester carboxylesterase
MARILGRIAIVTLALLGLADHFGWTNFRLVGHDWGGEVAWQIATRPPERVSRLAIFNAPHPLAWQDLDPASPKTTPVPIASSFVSRSSPPFVVRLNQWKALTDALTGSSRPDTFDESELAHLSRGLGATRTGIDPTIPKGTTEWSHAPTIRLDVPPRISFAANL